MDALQQRYAIFFLHKKNYTAEEIHQYLVEHAGQDAYSFSSVRHWLQQIKLNRTDFTDQKPSGRPIDDSIREDVRHQIQSDPYISARHIAKNIGHAPATVTKILHDEEGFKHKHLRKVPHSLTDDKRSQRVEEAKEILRMLESAERSHNSNIITGDESWFYYTNEPDARWIIDGEEIETKVQDSQYKRKKMVTIFIRKNGTFFVELMPCGQTFNSKYFIHEIIPKINDLAFPNGFSRGQKKALVHFDNAPSHTATDTINALGHYPFTMIPHPPYSPDISPLDFGVFGTIKGKMPYEDLETDEELKDTITKILNDLG
ncbi:MAG: hypothetical protein K2M99_06280, partial [Treponemataceae bacterium]|nr:hypothetical protein [Treponemataceae bacterium]